ncbi:alpha/beta fold hydrolase [Thiorhodococcus mannitoliphagus]|uniref:Alpha/beta fold hydrolase n=1 Tax=Thiorhodococcus mannitoliphagus TaxID=329406 RepID=A0A6P1DT28_9GAMM|nr:alpha/beta fold hydrolase [Thiorhodococcus mannitoliphagus]NEX20620.1 alpha/beta fold hydrolase [Thiorhodococcus mannitoliphagus]
MHGFTGDKQDWLACLSERSNDWLAIDLPGHGEAEDPTGDFTSVVRALLSALPPSIHQLVGYSLGGRIALGMLAQAPMRFSGATIISAHPGLTDPAQRAARLRQDARWTTLLETQGIAAFVAAWESQALFATQSRLAPQVLAQQRRRRLGQRASGLAASLSATGLGVMPSTWSELRAYPGCLRWIVGGADAKFLAIARQVVEMRPETALHVLPEIGHNPLLECPADLAGLLCAAHAESVRVLDGECG